MTLTALQQQERLTGIGGSDAAAVLGLSPWQTPLDVYLEKTGERVSDVNNDAVYWGSVLEDVIAVEYMRRTGSKVRRHNAAVHHPEHDFMLGNLDRVIQGERKLLECKTAGQYMADKWGPSGSGEIPDEYLAQITHYMIVTGFEHADVAVLIGGRDFRIYPFTLDRQFADILIEKESDFWLNHVKVGMPPPPTTIDDIQTLFAADDGSLIEADTELLACVMDLKDSKATLKEVEDRKKALELQLKAGIGNAAVLTDTEGKPLVTWKSQNSTRFNQTDFKTAHPELAAEYTTTSSYRVLRIK